MGSVSFQDLIHNKVHDLYRDMPWRRDTRPYYILVSELMLQQTQVSRVVPKFEEFVRVFPSILDLASASLGDVLVLWSGLGYNRRAKFLWQSAQIVQHEFGGVFPTTIEDLVRLPGVGQNTAGAIMVYAYNEPVVFVETNIRTVYLHHFFQDRDDVTDAEIREKLAETLDREHPREWYWALMDYGATLKSQRLGTITRSKHYTKQPKLAGSLREMRGLILRALAVGPMTKNQLMQNVSADSRFVLALDSLKSEGLIEYSSRKWHLPK